MLLPLLGGAALLGVGVAGAVRASHRRALPIDVAGTLRSALKTNDENTLQATLNAVAGRYPNQTNIIRNANIAAADAHVASDIAGMYNNALHTGQPENMLAMANALDVKYHYLSGKLRDVANIMSALTGVA
jgi:hypothetical protein